MPVCLAKIFFYVLCITFCWLPVSSHATIQYTYDQNGNLISGDGKYYEYNDANKLIRVRYQDSSGPVIAEYVYDHSGQRIKKIEDGITTYYVGKHFEKQVGTGNAKETKYYFANNARIAKKDQDGSLSFYHLDHLGSTSAVTDDSGNLKEKSRYFPFGDIRSGGSAQYTYTGKEKDKITNSYYFEARYYNPVIRHFTQPDWVQADITYPQNLNKYSYTKNNPIRFNDPSGNYNIEFGEISINVNLAKAATSFFSRLPAIAGKNDNILLGLDTLKSFANSVNDIQTGDIKGGLFGVAEAISQPSIKIIGESLKKPSISNNANVIFKIAEFGMNVVEEMHDNGYSTADLKYLKPSEVWASCKFALKDYDALLYSATETYSVGLSSVIKTATGGIFEVKSSDIQNFIEHPNTILK